MRRLRFFGKLVALLLVLGTFVGCGVRRTLEVESDPPGALVYLNGVEQGRTPMRTDFTFYGNYDVTLRREGYETVRTTAWVGPPLWQIPPIDLIAELTPFDWRDRRQLRYELEPTEAFEVNADAMIERGFEMRESLKFSRDEAVRSQQQQQLEAAEVDQSAGADVETAP